MFEEFLNHYKQLGRADKTIQNYLTTWTTFQNWMRLTHPELDDAGLASQKNISDYMSYLLQHGGRNGGSAKPWTMQLTFVQLNAIFRFFHERNYITDNPLEPIKKTVAATRSPRWLSQNEQMALIKEVIQRRSLREYAIVLTLLRLGLRVHELCDLQLTDLILSNIEGTACIKGKGDKVRELPVQGELLVVLQEYLKKRNSSSPYVFISKRSSKCSVRGIQHMIEKYRDLTGILDLNCQNLRHTFGHNLTLADPPIPIDRVAIMMGHYKEDGTPNVEMTMIYTTPGAKNLKE